MPVDQFCLMRSHVVAALVAFTILSITQLFILLNCLHNRCRAGDTGTREDTISCSSNGSFVSSQSYSSSVEDISRALAPRLQEREKMEGERPEVFKEFVKGYREKTQRFLTSLEIDMSSLCGSGLQPA